jgi:hypothetical protein
MEGPFFKSEMGGLLTAWHKACIRGRQSNSDACQRLDSSEVRRYFIRPFYRVLCRNLAFKPFHLLKKGPPMP